MSSRGHYIGEIVDELASIRARIEERGKLGLFDLHRQIEDFYKVLLNNAFGWKLVNVNTKRSNEPGVDLADTAERIAIQVTADGSRNKIQHTLDVFDAHHKANFDRLIVLVLGKKQGSYAIDETRFNFSIQGDIWDTNNVLKNLIVQEIEIIQRSYEYIKKENARIRIELELPDFDGKFPSAVAQFIERIPKPEVGDLAKSKEIAAEQKGIPLTLEEITDIEDSFKQFFADLSNLPRITRETLGELILASESIRNNLWVNYTKFKKLCRYDIDSEVSLLEYYKFVRLDPPDEDQNCYMLKLNDNYPYDQFITYLAEVAEKSQQDLREVLASMDFRRF